MKACGACGQPVPIRWRNYNHPVTYAQHVAGAVEVIREPPRPGYPWGRIADKVQACADCGTELMRGPWAIEWHPGEPVLETGAGTRTRVLSPRSREATPKCTEGNAPDSATPREFRAMILRMEDAGTPRYRLRVELQRTGADRVMVAAEDLTEVLNELDHLRPLGVPHLGRSPYGWRSHRGRLVPIEAEQTVLHRVAELREQGVSWRDAARRLTARHSYTRSGLEWTPGGLRDAFVNAAKYWKQSETGGAGKSNPNVSPVTGEAGVAEDIAAS